MLQLQLRSRRDFLGGCLVGLFGVAGLVEGRRLGTGTLTEMGPGFVPMALGMLLLGLGLFMTASQLMPGAKLETRFPRPDWRGWACIIGAVVAFIVLGEYAGFVPASFACVLIAALGDRTATVKASLLLAIGVTGFGVLLFHFILRVPIALFWW
jgi:hypothetical protein